MTAKSLAHPEWPYTGTPHEWRGFVKKQGYFAPLTEDQKEYIRAEMAVYQKQNFGPELK